MRTRVKIALVAMGAMACSTMPGTYNVGDGATEPLGEVGDGDASFPDDGEGDGGLDSTSTSGPMTSEGDEGSDSGGGGTGEGDADDGPQPPAFEPIPSAACAGDSWEPGYHLDVPTGNDARRYHVYVPIGHDGTAPAPVIIDFHGIASNPTTQSELSKFTRERADAGGYVVVGAWGKGDVWNGGSCCGDDDDVQYVRDVVEQLGNDVCIDTRRVFAAGFANGGSMVHRLACEASDVIAAVASVSGPMTLEPADCSPGRAVPVLHFHGHNNGACPIGGGGSLSCPPLWPIMHGWRDRDGCDETPALENFGEATCSTWSGCADWAHVKLCTVDGLGHCWPSTGCSAAPPGGPGSYPATDDIIAFFAAHPMP